MVANNNTVHARQTKYVAAVLESLADLRHATNAEILCAVHKDFPEVSATTIHRITTRLKERGVIGCAPKAMDGAERYDITAELHHHFMCTSCGKVCDFPHSNEAQKLIDQLKVFSKECALAGTLALGGVCERCIKAEE